MTTLIRGVIRGQTVELAQDSGLPEGQEVTVVLATVAPSAPPGEGLRRSAGTWAEDAGDLDDYLDWNRRQRRHSRSGANE